MTKALERIEKGKAKVVEIAHQSITDMQADEAMATAHQQFGAISAMWSLKGFVSSQVVMALHQFQLSKGYEHLRINGERFKSFDDFLDRHPQSPMTTNQYYSRFNRIKAEGPDVYDLLSDRKVPMAARKLIAAGSIQIEGDKVIAGAHSADVTDRKGIIEMVKALAAENESQSKKLEKGAADLDKQKRKFEALKKNPGAVDLALKQGPGEALMTLLGFYAAFREQIETLPEAERTKLRAPAMALIGNQHEMLAHALGVANTKKSPAKSKATALAQLNQEFGLNITEEQLEELDADED